MKSHDLARALSTLVKLLKIAPNMEIDSLKLTHSDEQIPIMNLPKNTEIKGSDIAINLLTLSSLSRISKQKWLLFIEKYKIEINIRPRDSALDILRNLLNYLEKNEDARKKLKKTLESPVEEASPELMKAFRFLLEDN